MDAHWISVLSSSHPSQWRADSLAHARSASARRTRRNAVVASIHRAACSISDGFTTAGRNSRTQRSCSSSSSLIDVRLVILSFGSAMISNLSS